MALEQLAGPYVINNADSETWEVWGGVSMFYDDELGLCGVAYVDINNVLTCSYLIIQLDGRAYVRSARYRPGDFTLDLQNLGEYLMTEDVTVTTLETFDKYAGVASGVVITGGTNYARNLHVRAADRFLYFNGNTVRYKALDGSGDFVVEATLSGAGSGIPTCSAVDSDIVCVVYQDGEVVYYNVTTKQQTGITTRLIENVGAWYSRRHDLFVVLPTDTTISVYANAYRPFSLSNPIVLDALLQGKVSNLRVRLLGEHGEPCVGEVVVWSLSGPGDLLVPDSVTDSDGYAYTQYLAPLVLSTDPTITATVEF